MRIKTPQFRENITIMAIVNGFLVSNDPLNPTRSGTFSDDYLLTGVSAGQVVQIDLTSPSGTNNFDTYLQLVNADTGAVIDFDDDGGLGFNSQLTFTAQQGVDYIVRATSFGSGATGSYAVTTNLGNVIPSTPITGDQTFNGTLTNTDLSNPTRRSGNTFRDDYLLTGVAGGQVVQIDLTSPSGTNNFDTYLQLVNADTGTVIDFDDDGGLGFNSQLTFTAQQGVDYIVRATSWGSGATGDYSLTSNVGVLYEAAPLGLNETISGTLDGTDLNNDLRSGRLYDGYFLNDLVAGREVQIDLNSGNFDTYVQLVNANTGTVINFDDDGGSGLNSRLTFTPQQGVDYIVRATSWGLNATGNYSLNVSDVSTPTPPTPTSGFDIDINFTGNWTANQRAIFQEAADRWSEIITQDIPDVVVNGQSIDDLVIEASSPFIDGNGGTLGQAGPRTLRQGSFLPSTGIMEFDSADVANLEADGQLFNVIVHEMGHVLGIGTIWDNLNLVTGLNTNNPRFTGAEATAAYNRIFGVSESSVPVANTGGPGTFGGHWRESVFDNELMTGFLNSGNNPISEVTVAALVDMGYGVDLGAADSYTPPLQRSNVLQSEILPEVGEMIYAGDPQIV